MKECKDTIKILSGKDFRKMQLLQLELLVDFDRVCRANNIRYSIGFGTMLGAIRHKGYIPWDDDADIAMLREDYEKFRKVANQLNTNICFFQDYEEENEYIWGYGKLRRVGTEFVRVGQEHLKHRGGFCIDIFPMDDIPLSIAGMVFQDCFFYVLRKVTYAQVGKKSEPSWFWRKWFSLISLIPVSFVFALNKKLVNYHNSTTPNRVRMLFYPSQGKNNKDNTLSERYGMEKRFLLDLSEYDFEGHKFFGPTDYDSYLTYLYGDYMKLPPEDKRIPHGPCSFYSFGEL